MNPYVRYCETLYQVLYEVLPETLMQEPTLICTALGQGAWQAFSGLRA